MNTGSGWAGSNGFGAANNASQSGGLFGNSASGAASQNTSSGLFLNPPASGSLFGNSNQTAQASTGGLFGQNNAGSNTTLTGLFGNNASQPNATSSGLFGNTNSNNTATTGGLFGNSAGATTSATTGATTGGSTGLLGNSSGQTGGLFGNTAGQSGGLFGNTAKPAGGLFGNTATNNTTQPAQGGLFAAKPATSGGLFGSSSAPSSTGNSLFGKPSTGTLGNASGTSLFGGNSAGTSLFGNLSSAQQQPSVNASNNPYASDILQNIVTTETLMPPSLTGLLWLQALPGSRKKSASQPQNPKKSDSLLGRLALTFRIFRSSGSATAEAVNSKVKGIFTQENYVSDVPRANVAKYSVRKPTRTANHSNGYGDIKKLVIKSKPVKFHLIDADKILSAKHKRVITQDEDNMTSDEELGEREIQFDPNYKAQKPVATPEQLVSPTPPVLQESVPLPGSELGYFSSPSLEDLAKLPAEDLTKVFDFIIGRIGHGQIAYNLPVDLSLLFDRHSQDPVRVAKDLFNHIVVIEGSQVRVYATDDLSLPERGTELNVPATITVKAPLKSTSTVESHIHKLKNLKGMVYVTFDPVSFNWTFKVEHFSVWGLIDDGEEEADESNENKRWQGDNNQRVHKDEYQESNSRLYENDAYRTELKRQKVERQTSGIPGGWDFDTTVHGQSALDIKQGLVRSEINQELNQFKERQSALVLAANASDITSDTDDEMLDVSQDVLNGVNQSQGYDNNYLKQIVLANPSPSALADIVDEKAYEPELDDEDAFNVLRAGSSVPVARDWLLQLEICNEIDSSLAPSVAISSSGRPVASVVQDILFSNMHHASVDRDQASTPKQGSRVSQTPKRVSESPENKSLSNALIQLVGKSTFVTRDNGLPQLSQWDDVSIKDLSELFCDEADSAYLQLASILFDLATALSLDTLEDPDNIALCRRTESASRRKQLATWLMKQADAKQSRFEFSNFDKIFGHVCRGDIREAVQLAVTTNNHHLASVLTMIDSNDNTVKKLAKAQVDTWTSEKENDLIPSVVRRIFIVLAGEIDSLLEELSFEEALALHLLYDDVSASLDSILQGFSHSSTDDIVADIISMYNVERGVAGQSGEEVLLNSGLSNLNKWVLHQIVDFTDSSDAVSDLITETFANQLLESGMWKEALYVTSSMSNDSAAHTKMKDVVISHGDELDSDNSLFDYLLRQLQIPSSLTYEAIAIEKLRKKDFWGSCEAFQEALLWEDAHSLICEELGPATVIRNDSATKARLRTILARFPDQGSIVPLWNQGAGFYLRYLNVVEAFASRNFIESSDLEFLLDNAALLHVGKSLESHAALDIVSKTVGDLAIENRKTLVDVPQRIKALKLSENEQQYLQRRLLCGES